MYHPAWIEGALLSGIVSVAPWAISQWARPIVLTGEIETPVLTELLVDLWRSKSVYALAYV